LPTKEDPALAFLTARWLSGTVLAVLVWAWAVPSFAAPPAEPEETLPALLKAKPLETARGDDELRKLQKERYNAALKELQLRGEVIAAGKDTPLDGIYDSAGRLLDAELDLAETPAERVAVRQKQVGLSKEVEATTKHFYEAGNSKVAPADVEKARYARLTAEINLLRARKDLPRPK
jgi:hypothetical protein